MNWEHIEHIAKSEPFGKVFVELTVHEKAITGANVQGSIRSKRYWGKDNVDAGKDILKIVKEAQDKELSGGVSIYLTFKGGLIQQMENSDLHQVRGEQPKKLQK